MGSLSDRAKVSLLVAAYLVCLLTLGTSPSMVLDNPSSLRTLPAPLRQHCTIPHTQAGKDCGTRTPPSSQQRKNNEGSSILDGCRESKKRVTQCEGAVQQAYRQINLGGCPSEINGLTLCEARYCQPAVAAANHPVDRAGCQTQCNPYRKSLKSCTLRLVEVHFRRHGLEKDGTMKVQ